MKKLIIALGALLGIGVLGLGMGVVYGNPLSFLAPLATNTATTSPTYMTAGTATTTICYDSFSATGSCTAVATGATGRPLSSDRVALLVQMVASSTLTPLIQLRVNTEYSQDGIDWYQDGGTAQNNFATTTKPFDISQVPQYNLNFASSTAGLGAVPAGVTTATTTRIIVLTTPTRFVRAIFTVPIGSGASNVWAQLVPSRQQNSN